jgi:hypothetical protein
MSGYMFGPHRAMFRRHIWMEPAALCSLMSILFVDVRPHYSQFWCFENISSFFYLHTAASLCPFVCAAPLVACTWYWFDVPCTLTILQIVIVILEIVIIIFAWQSPTRGFDWYSGSLDTDFSCVPKITQFENIHYAAGSGMQGMEEKLLLSLF